MRDRLDNGWNLKRLVEIASICSGNSISAKDRSGKYSAVNAAGRHFVSTRDVGFDGLINHVTDVAIPPKDQSNFKLAPKGSTLVCSEGGSAGRKVGLLKEDVHYGNKLFAITGNKNILPEMIFYFCQTDSFVEQFQDKKTGLIGGVSLSKFKTIEMPVPPLEEQQKIVAVLNEAFEGLARARAHVEANLQNVQELFENFLAGLIMTKADDWQTYSFGDKHVLQIVDGDRGASYPKRSDFMDKGHCLFLSTKNVRPDGFSFDETMFISQERDQALRKGKLRPRDVILTTRGTVGNIAFFDDNVPYEHIRINSGMLVLRPNEDLVRAEFLFELLRSGVIKEQIAEHVSGAAQPQLPIRSLIKFSLPAPKSTADQLVIVDKLKRLSDEVKELSVVYQRKIQGIDALRQSLLQNAFAGELT